MVRILSKFRSLYRLLGPGGCLLASVALAVLAIVTASLGWYWRLQRREAEELARIERAGEPVTIAELEAYYARPVGDEDLTAAWLAALAPLDSDSYSGSFDEAADGVTVGPQSLYNVPPPGEPWIEIDGARKLLAIYRTSLKGLHELSRRGGDARYDLDFRHGPFLTFPHCSLICKGVRLLLFEAEVRRHEGDVAAAVNALHAAYTLARTLQREPVCHPQLIRIECDGTIHAQLRRLLPELRLSASQFSLLRADLAAADYAQGAKHAIVGERAVGVAVFRSDLSIFDDSDESGDAAASAAMKILSLGALPDYLSWTDQFNQATRFPPHERLKVARRVKTDLANAARGSAWKRLRHLVLGWRLDTLALLFTSAARGESHRVCAETALAVVQCRQQTGKLPESLDELVPNLLKTLPLDPFDGQPLRYAAASNGCRIYSVGVDGIDQGGREGDASEPLDIVFDIEFAPLAVGE